MMPIHKHDAINIQFTINNNVTLLSGSSKNSQALKTIPFEIYIVTLNYCILIQSVINLRPEALS